MERRAGFFFIYVGTIGALSITGFVIMLALGQPDELTPGRVIPPKPTVAVYLVGASGPELWSVERPVPAGATATLSVFPAGRDRVAVVARDAAGRAEVLHDARPALLQQAAMVPVRWVIPRGPASAELAVVVGAPPLSPSDAEAALEGRARGAGAWVEVVRLRRLAGPPGD